MHVQNIPVFPTEFQACGISTWAAATDVCDRGLPFAKSLHSHGVLSEIFQTYLCVKSC